MKHVFGLISYTTLHFIYFFCELKFMKYSYKDYMHDVEHYHDDLNLY